jgi:hypothetical protein
VAAPFRFEHTIAFSPENATETLRDLPTLPGVFALHGPAAPEGQPAAQPYLTRAADLRRRITRILAPPDSQSKRLNLRDRVARIDYTVTGSEFESHLTLYHASAALFGLDEARRRLKLRTPFFLRFTAGNAYPRVYSTNRLGKRALSTTYGPFPSRAAADRYCDAVLDLFKLRRCVEDLAPYPEHPGCVYQEMKKCLAPCNQACNPEGAAAYAAEALAVRAFFDSHGESMLAPLAAEREAASISLDFERAARVHEQWQRVRSAQSLADPLVTPIPNLRALILQKAAPPQDVVILSGAKNPRTMSEEAGAPHLDSEMWAEAPQPSPASSDPCSLPPIPCSSVFLLHSGCLTGPACLSTLGVRAVKEQTSVGSSLFAQPLMLQAIPLEESGAPGIATEVGAPHLASEMWASATESPAVDRESPDPCSPIPVPSTPTLNPEARATTLIAALEQQASEPTDLATLSDHLSLLRRWYYRPEKHRAGEVFFPKTEAPASKTDSSAPSEDAPEKLIWPIRRILNGAARLSLGDPKPLAETQRDLATRNSADADQKPTRTKTLHPNRPDVERVVPLAGKNPGTPPAFKSRRKSH